jgi:molybdopterin-guanine dinucleotide biosynthesis protein B
MKVFGFCGYSGAGKTTLIESLIPRFVAHGLKVSLIKHTHHGFDMDRPGKDSWRHREAGAVEVMLVSDQRWVLMHEMRDAPPPQLPDMLHHLSPCDLVILEGFKTSPWDKIEVHRVANGKPLIWPDAPGLVAVVRDQVLDSSLCGLPQLDINDHAAVASFVLKHCGLE